MLKTVIGAILGPVMDVVSEVVVDKDERSRIRGKLTEALIAQETALVQASRDVVLAEAQGTWMQRNWRPSLMFCFIAVIANNYILLPYAPLFGLTVPLLDFPEEFWGLMTVGVGGYVAGRTIEKVGPTISIGGVSQGNKDNAY